PSAPLPQPKNDFARPSSSYVKLPQASSSTAEKLCFRFLAMASIFATIAADRSTCFRIFPSGLRPAFFPNYFEKVLQRPCFKKLKVNRSPRGATAPIVIPR
ncbi:MAG: hypothetical protein ACKOF3_06610, partial [Spartobacteria bacterium]